jgi:hypothetical protein
VDHAEHENDESKLFALPLFGQPHYFLMSEHIAGSGSRFADLDCSQHVESYHENFDIDFVG